MREVRARLRAAVEPSHRRVESALGLGGDSVPVQRVTDALALLHGFFAPMETAMDAWALRSPGLAGRVDWPRRRRTGILAADLHALGAAPLLPHPPRAVTGDADALAWLYVAEGSTLGGAVIGRSLAGQGVDVPRSFAPYAEGPGPMWHRYLDTAEEWAADDLRRTALVAAAVDTFAALAEWVERPAVEGVA